MPPPTNQFDKLQAVLAATFAVEPHAITTSTTQDDLEPWDSVGHMTLMVALEDAFGVTLEVEEMLELTSVADILELLDRSRV
jgi:acyl carrier protein